MIVIHGLGRLEKYIDTLLLTVQKVDAPNIHRIR